MMVPYERRVREVIDEEFSAQGIRTYELPEQHQAAIQRIVERLAWDLENLYQNKVELVGRINAELIGS